MRSYTMPLLALLIFIGGCKGQEPERATINIPQRITTNVGSRPTNPRVIEAYANRCGSRKAYDNGSIVYRIEEGCWLEDLCHRFLGEPKPIEYFIRNKKEEDFILRNPSETNPVPAGGIPQGYSCLSFFDAHKKLQACSDE